MFAAGRLDVGAMYYVGLAVVVVILVVALLSFYRTWMEIHEDEEPDSPQDLLESFREAHAAGQIDARELERVQTLLTAGAATTAGALPVTRPSAAMAEGKGPDSALPPDSSDLNRPAPPST
jgi:hypothetical protein